MDWDEEAVFAKVREVLAEVAGPRGPSPAEIAMESSLLADLGIDSLTIMEVAVALEEALPIGEYPVQRWLDVEAGTPRPFRVSSMVATCLDLMTCDLGDSMHTP